MNNMLNPYFLNITQRPKRTSRLYQRLFLSELDKQDNFDAPWSTYIESEISSTCVKDILVVSRNSSGCIHKIRFSSVAYIFGIIIISRRHMLLLDKFTRKSFMRNNCLFSTVRVGFFFNVSVDELSYVYFPYRHVIY